MKKICPKCKGGPFGIFNYFNHDCETVSFDKNTMRPGQIFIDSDDNLWIFDPIRDKDGKNKIWHIKSDGTLIE